jgi:hypothetical protein
MTLIRLCVLRACVRPRLLVAMPLMLLLAGGCSAPTEIDRDNARVVAEIMTALTLKNARLLEAGASRAEARHDAGQFSDDDYDQVTALVDKGRAGDWVAAETDAYAFRKRRPFVRPGQ